MMILLIYGMNNKLNMKNSFINYLFNLSFSLKYFSELWKSLFEKVNVLVDDHLAVFSHRFTAVIFTCLFIMKFV